MPRKESATKRSLFSELTAGVAAMREHREGRLTLRTQGAKRMRLPELAPFRRRADSSR
jgi:hypothetical protein